MIKGLSDELCGRSSRLGADSHRSVNSGCKGAWQGTVALWGALVFTSDFWF